MFGQNPVRGKDAGDGSTLRVQAVFDTIQGEGPFAGTPAVFVRLAGCNLRCWFCDTDFESNYDNVMTVDALLDSIYSTARGRRRLVVLTGGEPLLQNVGPLCNALTSDAYGTHVQIETAGTVWRPELDGMLRDPYSSSGGGPGVSLVVSPKTHKVQATPFMSAGAWKYIIPADGQLDQLDGLPVNSTQRRGEVQRLARPPQWLLHQEPERVLLQPCDHGDSEQSQVAQQRAVQTAMHFGYRVSLQQHKILGLE